ncbi:YgjV family protein [Niameybacter massiliensis]|uniref:YgjV family protein n=2 Tax=Lachnospirales TaxID=3085636 RepID=A0AA42DJX4_9FIRM|nr:YgjV family protein [Holtiella tumoricola]MDA3730212.1 YgjV family protein [Holtiella tumoricola]
MFGGWIEWIGYAASVGIVISLLMTNMVKLRVINSIGCVLFVIYGVLVGAYPVVISNAAIVVINAYQLYKLSKEKN